MHRSSISFIKWKLKTGALLSTSLRMMTYLGLTILKIALISINTKSASTENTCVKIAYIKNTNSGVASIIK